MKRYLIIVALNLFLVTTFFVGCSSEKEKTVRKKINQPEIQQTPTVEKEKSNDSSVARKLKEEGFDPQNATNEQVENLMFGGGK